MAMQWGERMCNYGQKLGGTSLNKIKTFFNNNQKYANARPQKSQQNTTIVYTRQL